MQHGVAQVTQQMHLLFFVFGSANAVYGFHAAG